MNRFRQLLKPSGATTPGEEQRRASEQLPRALAASPFRAWHTRSPQTGGDDYLLLIIAPYSQYDLTLLDVLEPLARKVSTFPVFVGNLLDYPSLEHLKKDLPDLDGVPATPIAKHCSHSVTGPTVSGKAARDLIASLFHLNPDTFSRHILSETPRYNAEATPVPA